MGQFDGDKEFPVTDPVNSFLNLHQFSCSQEIDAHAKTEFDIDIAQNEFLEQILSSVPSSSFPWFEEYQVVVDNSEEKPFNVRQQQQISSAEAKSMMIQQQQFLLSRERDAGNSPMTHCDQNDVVDRSSLSYFNLPNHEALFTDFEASYAQNSIPSQHFNNLQAATIPQSQNHGIPATIQPTAIGSSSGATAAQPRQRVRARRGQATDPHSIAERLRRERISERMKALQELVPNANKTDKASMLDEIIDHVKFLQHQVKVLSISRLGGPAAPAPAPAPASVNSYEGRRGNSGGLAATEQQVAKLMEEDMSAAMQYLQNKGFCLMPISLATAISTSQQNPVINGEDGPSSPSMSALTVQSVAVSRNTVREIPVVKNAAE